VDPTPQEEAVVFQTTLPLYTYIPLMDILIIHSLTYSNLIMTTPHQPKQIKSHWYYVFWSLATLAVVLGQVYVATSYRALANALTLTLT